MDGPHFFVAPEAVDGDTATLGGHDAHHLTRVLRARRGDPVSVADGTGAVWQGRLVSADETGATVALADRRDVAATRPRVTVVHALPRGRKLDEVVQRLTEVGADRIVPVSSARSELRLDSTRAAKAVARWRAVALAAAKQSRRARLPRIDEVGAWVDAFGAGATGVVCWEESGVPLRRVLDDLGAPDELIVGIGPEGGLTPEEVADTGLPHASLGPTVLRTETAALVAVSAVRYHHGLFG